MMPHRPLTTILLAWSLLLTGSPACSEAAESVQVNPVPPVQPDTRPQHQNPGGGSPLSVDSLRNTSDNLRYEPYNTFPRELDLWNLEGRRMIRSEAVVSPDRSAFAYSEVIFLPQVRQTSAKLYLVTVPPLLPKTPRLPSEEATESNAISSQPRGDRFDPNQHLKERKTLASAGYNKIIPFAFHTLTPVDWSNSGKRLLFKQRSGVLHLGLKVSDILVYGHKGTTTIYPEVHRVIQHYWHTQGNIPELTELAWDIQPLGWEPGSDNLILLKAWAYDHKSKKFLGLWQYDLDAERTRLLSLEDSPTPVAANGWIARPQERHE